MKFRTIWLAHDGWLPAARSSFSSILHLVRQGIWWHFATKRNRIATTVNFKPEIKTNILKNNETCFATKTKIYHYDVAETRTDLLFQMTVIGQTVRINICDGL